MIKYETDITSFKSWVDNSMNFVDWMMYEIVKEATEDVYREIKDNHPVDTWKTKESITKTVTSKWLWKAEWEIVWPTEVSVFLEAWTKTHMIKPVNAASLKFKVWWKTVFSKWHKVKGIKPNKIFENAFRKLVNSYDIERKIWVKIRKITW